MNRLYEMAATRLQCCGCFIGCGMVILVTGGTFTGVAGYGAYRVLA